MTGKTRLDGKRILLVDDEPDVLESLEGLLPNCDVVKATTFDGAKNLLESEYFDIVILDIMGVDGYRLLEIAAGKKVIAVMLTARALSPDNIVKSYKEGASYFVPKEQMAGISTFLNEVLEAIEQGKSPWKRWFERFARYWADKYGPDWQQGEDGAFWKKFGSYK